jgi:adenylosuccinate lyase
MNEELYQNPLAERYASKEMLGIFSAQQKFSTWRKLWLVLAESQKELGLSIPEAALAEMRANVDHINFDVAQKYEKELRHDVMAHVYAFAEQAPSAKAFLHLGATSAFVVDNTDLILMRQALVLIKKNLLGIVQELAKFAETHKALPTLGYTHFQAAQPTTVGKRATLWIQSLLLDLEDLDYKLDNLRLRGAKGTTGTAESFKKLFQGDFETYKKLDQKIAQKLGFENLFAVTGQTYDRKVDSGILQLLSQIAQSAHKFTNDLRLLQHLKEIEEPFEKNQIGSSAMAYKRNPMRSERMASLAKFVMALPLSTDMVAATQWFERTLDDSANKRLAIPQAFLAIDAILLLWRNVASSLVVYPNRIAKNMAEELPFLCTEEIIMHGVKKGLDRQELHEKIRIHSQEAAKQVKELGKKNDLLQRIASDAYFGTSLQDLEKNLDAKHFIGFALEQTEDFLQEIITPILDKNKAFLPQDKAQEPFV